MKINGLKIEGPNEEIVVIPRESGDLIFKCKAILDFKEFDKLCPEPTAPEVVRRDQTRFRDEKSPEYIKEHTEWAEKRTAYMFVTSLMATDGLEFEKVNIDDPDTWALYNEEMKESGLSEYDMSRLLMGVTTACGFNQEKIDEATKRFLATREEGAKS